MAPNLFYGTGIAASILVLNRDKPAERKGKVLFIDASAEFEEGTNHRLRDQDIEHISKAFHGYADVEKYARVVPLTEIEAERLEPQHQPLRGYLGRGGADRRRGRRWGS